MPEPGEDTCLDCRHEHGGDHPCEALVRSEDEPEGVPCGCTAPWTRAMAAHAAATQPASPDPWATPSNDPPPF